MSISQLSAQDRLRASAAAATLRKSATTSAATPSPMRQPDEVSISDAAKSLAAARNAVGSASDTRDDKVSALKAAIADGSYAVDSRRLASAMVKSGFQA